MPGLRWAGPTGKLRRSPGGSDELPPRLPCRQPRRCAQTPGAEPDLRPAVAQGGPVRLPRQPRRRRPLRPGRRPGQPHRRVAAGHRPHLAGRNPPGAARRLPRRDPLAQPGRRAALLPGLAGTGAAADPRAGSAAAQREASRGWRPAQGQHVRRPPRGGAPGRGLACTAGADADPREARGAADRPAIRTGRRTEPMRHGAQGSARPHAPDHRRDLVPDQGRAPAQTLLSGPRPQRRTETAARRTVRPPRRRCQPPGRLGPGRRQPAVGAGG